MDNLDYHLKDACLQAGGIVLFLAHPNLTQPEFHTEMLVNLTLWELTLRLLCVLFLKPVEMESWDSWEWFLRRDV